MTSLLIGTFVIGGVHTLLWLPRALQMRRASNKKFDQKEPLSTVQEKQNSDNTRKDGAV
jgi:hypothetical protein